MSKAKQLQSRIDELRKEIQSIAGTDLAFQKDSAVQIAHRQSEIFVLASQLAEMSTRRIIYLTWTLAILTGALLLIGFVQIVIMIPQYRTTNTKNVEASKNQQAPNNSHQLNE